jgi:phosphoribosyl 1,2-cyclic phosphodiesterase
MRVTILASGSSGNAVLLQAAATSVLIDIGLTAKRINGHLNTHGIEASSLAGVLLTHEHGDHTRGLRVFCANSSVPVFTNPLTADSLKRSGVVANWNLFASGAEFQIGDLRVHPFSVPHDAADPVGFVFRYADSSFAVLTDLGYATKQVVNCVQGVNALLIETNHDETMLQNDTKRPWPVKQRILSRHGHLSNAAAAEIVANVATPQLRYVLLGHMSEDCNSSQIATQTVRSRLDTDGHTQVEILCASGESGCAAVSITI